MHIADRESRRILRRVPGRWGHLAAGIKVHTVLPDVYRARNDKHLGIIYVLRGSGVYRRPNSPNRSFESGALLLRFPYEDHETEYLPGDQFIEAFFAFDEFLSQFLVDSILFERQARVRQIGSSELILREFGELMDRMELPESQLPGSTLLLEILRFLDRLLHSPRKGRDEPAHRLVQKALEYLDTVENGRADLEMLAADLGVSYTVFRRTFRQITGISPGQYLIRRRIQRACDLLHSHPIPTVAETLGYPDAFAFSRQFKQHTGLPPSVYQKQNRR